MAQVEEIVETPSMSEADEVLCVRLRQISASITMPSGRRAQIHSLIQNEGSDPEEQNTASSVE